MFLNKFANLPPRKRMGLIAIVLGVIAVFASDPFDKSKTMINLKELSLVSSDEISNVTVLDLADAIIKSKYDYRLIDLRDSEEFNKYNIPSSENISVDQILSSDLARNENILLYSDNDIESTQAWFLLSANSFKGVRIIKGGIDNWKNRVLFPKCSCGENPTKEQLHRHAKLQSVSKFFGGSMQKSSLDDSNQKVDMPELKAPARITLKKAQGKKKREGC